MSALRLVHQPAAPPAGAPAVGDYLDRLSIHLKLGAAARADVILEIEDHLRDRVRDLMVNGLTEQEAALKAVAELGEPAVLAARFTAAIKRPQRRRNMNLGLFGLGTAAIATALLTMGNPGSQPGVSVFHPAPAQSAAGGAPVSAPSGSNWETFFGAAGKSAKLPVFVNWPQLAAIDENIHADGGMDVEIGEGFSLDRALTFINESRGWSPDDGIAYRVEDGVLTFASAEYFDLRETVLTSFDLSDVAVGGDGKPLVTADVDARMERVLKLVQSIVHPSLWVDNGGDRASLYSFGSKLFIKAPKRLLPQVEWLLSEVRGSTAKADAAAKLAPEISERTREVLHGQPALAVKQFHLGHIDSATTAAFLERASRISPALRNGLSLAPSAQTNSLMARGTGAQLETVESLVKLLDRPAPELSNESGSHIYTVSHTDADAVRELIGVAFNISPAVKQCAVPRTLGLEGSSILLSASQDQLAWVNELIDVIDRPVEDR